MCDGRGPHNARKTCAKLHPPHKPANASCGIVEHTLVNHCQAGSPGVSGAWARGFCSILAELGKFGLSSANVGQTPDKFGPNWPNSVHVLLTSRQEVGQPPLHVRPKRTEIPPGNSVRALVPELPEIPPGGNVRGFVQQVRNSRSTACAAEQFGGCIVRTFCPGHPPCVVSVFLSLRDWARLGRLANSQP